MIVRVFLLYWMAFPCGVGPAIALMAANSGAPEVAIIALAVSLSCALGYLMLWFVDRRNRGIRRLLGRHELGTSDPAMWESELLESISKPDQLYGTESFADAALSLTIKNELSAAMFAARMTVALEDATEGEKLTNLILKSEKATQIKS